MDSPAHAKRDIIRYMSIQAPDEEIVHAERIASEAILEDRYDIWDVHTDKSRWWVITPLTNLYSQQDFPSMDYALSFHIGLMHRMSAREGPDVTDEHLHRAERTWRKWTQAAESLDKAEEAEDFQAVGLKLRECLISFVSELARPEYVRPGMQAPKRADVAGWMEVIANSVAPGDTDERLRSYLKRSGKATWDLVQLVTHAGSARRLDGLMALNGSQMVMTCFLFAAVRAERRTPDRCRDCSSYRLVSDYRPELGDEHPYVTLCETCGWQDEPQARALPRRR
jgi:hypothetical protein